MEKENEMVLDQDSSEQEQELELDETLDTEESVEEDNQGNDPLDDIQDVEAAIKEAKKYRSIAQRKKKAKEEASKEEPIESDSNYLTKRDFEKTNEKKGIRLATAVSDNDAEELIETKKDILANWEDVRQLYTPRRGKATPEDIYEDIKDAYVLFNARRPKVEESDGSANVLTETSVKQGTGSKPKPVTPKKEPKNFKIPAQPDEWYN